MSDGPEPLDMLSTIREARDALVRCDSVRLEQILRCCESRVPDAEAGLLGTGFISPGEGNRESEVFVRLLEFTYQNIRILGRLPRIGSAQLEYSPAHGE